MSFFASIRPEEWLPFNFGLINLDSPVHGNVTVNLKDGGTMKVNSVILSLNSSVFKEMFDEFHLSTVDMQDFQTDTAREFFNALYRGRVNVNRKSFRELCKMATVFKVNWLQLTIRRFLILEYNNDNYDRIKNNDSNTFFLTLEWMFEESVYAKKVCPTVNSDLVGFVVNKFWLLPEDIVDLFVKAVLSDFNKLSHETLDVVMQICDPHYTLIADLLKKNLMHLETRGLSNNTRFLLENFNFVKGYKIDPTLYYEEIFDVLLSNMDKLEKKDRDWIVKLNRDSSKAVYSLPVVAHDCDTSGVDETSDEGTFVTLEIFTDFDIEDLVFDEDELTFYEIIRQVGHMPETSNLYIFFDALFALARAGNVINIERVWGEKQLLCLVKLYYDHPSIHRGFVESGAEDVNSCEGDINVYYLLSFDEIFSDHCLRLNSVTVTAGDLFKKVTWHMFEFHSPAPQCKQCSCKKCVFVVRVTPNYELENAGEEDPVRGSVDLHVEMVIDGEDELGQAGYCTHHDLVTPANTHLVLQLSTEDGYTRFNSWKQKPHATFQDLDQGTFLWDDLQLDPEDEIRFVAYVKLDLPDGTATALSGF